MASTSRSNSFESCTLAAVSCTDALPIDQDVIFAAPLTAIGRVRASLLTAALGADADAVDAGAAPIDGIQVTQPVEDDLVHRVPDTELLPLTQATRGTAQLADALGSSLAC
jgi:hypothetical protein